MTALSRLPIVKKSDVRRVTSTSRRAVSLVTCFTSVSATRSVTNAYRARWRIDWRRHGVYVEATMLAISFGPRCTTQHGFADLGRHRPLTLQIDPRGFIRAHRVYAATRERVCVVFRAARARLCSFVFHLEIEWSLLSCFSLFFSCTFFSFSFFYLRPVPHRVFPRRSRIRDTVSRVERGEWKRSI